jgi:hypothetical protein
VIRRKKLNRSTDRIKIRNSGRRWSKPIDLLISAMHTKLLPKSWSQDLQIVNPCRPCITRLDYCTHAGTHINIRGTHVERRREHRTRFVLAKYIRHSSIAIITAYAFSVMTRPHWFSEIIWRSTKLLTNMIY